LSWLDEKRTRQKKGRTCLRARRSHSGEGPRPARGEGGGWFSSCRMTEKVRLDKGQQKKKRKHQSSSSGHARNSWHRGQLEPMNPSGRRQNGKQGKRNAGPPVQVGHCTHTNISPEGGKEKNRKDSRPPPLHLPRGDHRRCT